MNSWRNIFSKPLALIILFKLIYIMVLIGAELLFPLDQSAPIFHSRRQAWTTDGHLTFASHFTSWDTEHYLWISEHGYQPESDDCAFYPLWPLAVRYFSPLVGGGHVLGGFLLANLISACAWLVFFHYVRRRQGEPTAWLALALLVSFPGSLFFQFNYTESLFFLLLMLLVYGLDNNRFWLVMIAGALLPLTRAIGFFCLAPILFFLMTYKESCRTFVSRLIGGTRWGARSFEYVAVKDATVAARLAGRHEPSYWYLLPPVAGWGLYFLLMTHWTGNPFSGFEAQKSWGVQSVGNLFNLPKFIMGFFEPTSWHEFNGSLLDRCVFFFVLLTLPLIWKLRRDWLVWTLVLGVMPAVSGTFVSYTRFASMLFPVFIALAVFLHEPKRRLMRFSLIYGFYIIHLWLLWRFVNYSWAG